MMNKPRKSNKTSKPSAVCTLATSNSLKDLKLFIYSLRLFEKDIPIYILCDTETEKGLTRFKKDENIHLYPQLDKYSNKNRNQMEELGIWTEFMLRKCDIIDIALENCSDVLFADADICFLNCLLFIYTKRFEIGGSPHFIRKSDTDKYGYYNGGYLWVRNPLITTKWKEYSKKSRFYEQAAIEDLMKEFKSFEFPIQNNFGWWRLFQCDNSQDRMKQFTICSESGFIFFEDKPLRSIHTHLTQDTDVNMPLFNNIISQLLNGGKNKNKNYARLLIYLNLVKNGLV